ncbi:MAG: hypothetical protein E6Q97_28900 [Desulfurellales bacterium]|nr:MAG: hypothetical protein E6Q97_28900 [Desulfurellales bacterium]
MKKEQLIPIFSVLALLVYWWAQKKRAAAVAPVDIGRLETTTTSQASAPSILAQALDFTRANEDENIKRLRNDIGSKGLSVTSCSLVGTSRWCKLSNGWQFPSWLLIDYLGMKDPASNN